MPTGAAMTEPQAPRSCWIEFFLWAKEKGLTWGTAIQAGGDMLTHGGWRLMDGRVFHSTFPRVTESKNGLEEFKNRDGFCIRYKVTQEQYDRMVAETEADRGKPYPVLMLFYHLLNRYLGIKVKAFLRYTIFVCSGQIMHILNVGTGRPEHPELYGPTEMLGFFSVEASKPGDDVEIYDLKGDDGLVWAKNNTSKHRLLALGQTALSSIGGTC